MDKIAVAPTPAGLIIPVMLAQTVNAANVEDGGFSQGFRDGKSDGAAYQQNGVDHVSCLGSDHSVSYCLGYRAGYRAAHGAGTLAFN